MRPFGYHIKGGTLMGSALKEAVEKGFTAAQIFLGAPQRFESSEVSAREFDLFQRVKQESGIRVFVHASYVLHAWAKPENVLRNNIAIAAAIGRSGVLGCDGYVLHTGGTKWYEPTQYAQVLEALLDRCSMANLEKCPLLIENCASGKLMSGDLSLIAEMTNRFRSRGWNIGVCLDTCHAWAFGYDFSDRDVLDFMYELLRSEVKLIHLNSAPQTVSCGSHFDRHSSIEKGCIDPHAFERLLVKFSGIPCIAERDDVSDVIRDGLFVKAVDSVGLCDQCKGLLPETSGMVETEYIGPLEQQ